MIRVVKHALRSAKCSRRNFSFKIPEPPSSKLVQEHDYTVMPNTYTYSAEANSEQFDLLPLLDSRQLALRKHRPRRAKILARDFIEDSLYNPNYGYFSKHAEILSSKAYDFSKMRNIDVFLNKWTEDYSKQVENTANAPKPSQTEGDGSQVKKPKSLEEEEEEASRGRLRQMWHTPSELFHPYYGWSLARYILANFDKDPQPELLIYEAGAGNGTLMVDILDYIRNNRPDVYSKLLYTVIEISPALVARQNAHASGHSEKFRVLNESIFNCSTYERRPCFFISLELWDNLSHDVVRYDNDTGKAHQGYVVVGGDNSFTSVFSSKLDSLASEYLDVRASLEPKFTPNPLLGRHPLSVPAVLRRAKNRLLTFHDNFSGEEYLPTRFYQYLKTLRRQFPQHHLLASDFTHFDERIRGYCSPVVQTYIHGQPVATKSYMVLQGYFDIMFPTDFVLAKQLYSKVCGKSARVQSHGKFLREWAVPQETATKTGESPMLEFYRNAAFIHTVK